MATRKRPAKNDGTEKNTAKKRLGELTAAWRLAMRGDEAALESLLPLAVAFDPQTVEGSGARRMVGRAFQLSAKTLEARAATATPAQAAVLREQSRLRFYQAVLARHVDLKAVSAATSLLPAEGVSTTGEKNPVEAPQEPAVVCDSILDPPPDAPADVIAATSGLANLAVKVRWSVPNDHGKAIGKPNGASGYDVYVTPKVLAMGVSITGNEATITNLALGSTYTVTVTATNSDGVSPASLPSNSVKVGSPVPAAPGPVLPRLAGGLLALDWTAPATGAPLTQYRVSIYDSLAKDAAGNPLLLRTKSVDAQLPTTLFSDLPKGTYLFGVRAFNAGGFGAETLSKAFVFTPVLLPFTPDGLQGFSSGPAMLFDTNRDLLDPDRLRRRMDGALEQANKWRFDYLKSIATKAAGDTLQYEQHIMQLMAMTLSKVNTAELLLSPVLQETLKTLEKDLGQIQALAFSDEVDGVVGLLGESIATALSLEGLLKFLIDNQPLDFWMGLFNGLIDDIGACNSNIPETNKFLLKYFKTGPGTTLLAAVGEMKEKVNAIVDGLAQTLRGAVSGIVGGTNTALADVLRSIGNQPLLQTAAPGMDAALAGVSPLAPLTGTLDELTAAVEKMIDNIRKKIDGYFDEILNGEGLIIKVIKYAIVYPILGILVISFALGGIGAVALNALVAVSGIELVRQVARWLTGPLLGLLHDAQKAVNEALGNLTSILGNHLNALGNPAKELMMVGGHLAELRELLPEAFVSDAAALLGDARGALLDNATRLALAAERALGLEHGTAFDVVPSHYRSGITPAPQLPGGLDPSFLSGAAILRDFNRLDQLRTRLADGKELVFTHRLSLHKLLGGLGDPATASGEPAKLLKQLLAGGKMILNLSEEALIDNGMPGLYRVLISDIRPVGVFGAAAAISSALPITLPLTLTHLGSARTRVKRDANPHAPPVTVPPMLKLTREKLLEQVLESATLQAGDDGRNGKTLKQLVDQVIADVLAAATFGTDLGPNSSAVYRGFHPTRGHVYTAMYSDFQPGGRLADFTPEGENGPQPVFWAFRLYNGKVPPGTVPMYDLERSLGDDPKRDHLYLIDRAEAASATTLADNFDNNDLDSKIAFYVFPIDTADTIPLYRGVYNGKSDEDGVLHFYSTNRDELLNASYKLEGPQGKCCGVRAAYGTLRSAPLPGHGVTDQVRDALLKRLPDVIATALARAGDRLVDVATLANTVRRLVNKALSSPLPGTGGAPDAAAIKSALAQLDLSGKLRKGIVPDGLQPAVPGLDQLFGDAHAIASERAADGLAKWGGTRFEEDRDPQVRALGYMTMIQPAAPETAIFNLLPNASPLASLLSTPQAQPDSQAPMTSLGSLQYRPFENRPIEGALQLSMELPVPAGTLVDLLLEITVRGCYDENLAAAVKASRRQGLALLQQGNTVAGAVSKLLNLPGALPRTDTTAGALQTHRFSLRAHRDKLLQMANAALKSTLNIDEKDLGKPKPIDGLKIVLDTAALSSEQPLGWFLNDHDEDVTELGWQFQLQNPGRFGSLARVLPLTPEMFGIASTASSLLGSDIGEISSLAISVIPSRKAFVGDNLDKLNAITAKIDPLLARLLPELSVAGKDAVALPRRITATVVPPGGEQRVRWSQVWGAARSANPDQLPLPGSTAGDQTVAPFLSLNFGDALKSELIHDVIFTIGSRVPVVSLNTSPAAV